MLVAGEEVAIVLQLYAEIGLCGVEEVALVDVLHEGFKRECNDKADGDDDEMEGEVAPGVDGFMRGVDIHARCDSGNRGSNRLPERPARTAGGFASLGGDCGWALEMGGGGRALRDAHLSRKEGGEDGTPEFVTG